MSAKKEVKKVIKQFFKALDNQDTELVKQLHPESESMVHIGTDGDEIWKGWENLWKATQAQFDSLEYYKANIRNLTIHISDAGDTAWYFHLLDARIKSKGRPEIVWEETRFTGVLQKIDDNWKIVQTHVSVPESN